MKVKFTLELASELERREARVVVNDRVGAGGGQSVVNDRVGAGGGPGRG